MTVNCFISASNALHAPDDKFINRSAPPLVLKRTQIEVFLLANASSGVLQEKTRQNDKFYSMLGCPRKLNRSKFSKPNRS